MSRFFKGITEKTGLAPGTAILTGSNKKVDTQITVVEYNQFNYREREIDPVKVLITPEKDMVSWINVEGMAGIDAFKEIGSIFNLHDLVLEDILDLNHRPKLENHGNYIYILVKMLYSSETGKLGIEQVSIILGPNYVISFSEDKIESFKPVKERIKKNTGRIRKMGADYLVYSLLDLIVDNYFVALVNYGNIIDELEEIIIRSPSAGPLKTYHDIKIYAQVRLAFAGHNQRTGTERLSFGQRIPENIPERYLRSYLSSNRYRGNIPGHSFRNA